MITGHLVAPHNLPGYNFPLLNTERLDEEENLMPQRVTLDAMIPRADFALAESAEFDIDLFQGFPINNLERDSPILKLMRKPDFQRETNHWTPEQLSTFVASFLDNEVIPSLILWKSPTHIFVIDGGHRLSALRAWMEDDYGDRAISSAFYNSAISEDQKKIASRTRKIIEKAIGRFSDLKNLVGATAVTDEQKRRANKLFTRTLNVQWIQGSAAVAETSFFKINSQGTPLDETETMLITNRRKPIGIGARAILRGGAGHKYWSRFERPVQEKIESLAAEFHKLIFQPEIDEPLKTLEIPLGGSVSPVDALALLVEFLAITGTRQPKGRSVAEYKDDEDGTATIEVLKNSLEIVSRITGNSSESLGLHPAVYFYNEKGKYSRFLFLGMSTLLTERARNNDSGFFKKFTKHRAGVEQFLMENKSLIGILLQNMSKSKRVQNMKEMLSKAIERLNDGGVIKIEELAEEIGLEARRIIDVVNIRPQEDFTDDSKAKAFISRALASALLCPICGGKLDPNKSIQYDHIKQKRLGGDGAEDNCQLVHPYCNSGYKN